MTNRQSSLRRPAQSISLLFCLLTPSLWLMANIPPLWKDADAYLQVTGAPDSSAFLHYGPLYCFLARVPLFLGYYYDCLRVGLPLPTGQFFAQPILSDAGVWLLVLFQHCALAGSSLFLIATSARAFRARLALTVIWAINPLFYIWAHSVASEALSLILVLLLATVAFRIARQPGKVSLSSWLSFGILLTLCLLTRYLNGLLAALLPTTLAFAGLARIASRSKSDRARRWLRDRARKDLRRAAIAAAAGLAAIALANATLHGFAYTMGIDCHTSAGFTFLFRLGFLAPLSFEERAAFLEKISRKNPSPEVRTMLGVLRDAPAEVPRFETMDLLAEAQARLPSEIVESDEKLTDVLQQTARAFLLPPSPELLRAVGHDFAHAQRETLEQMVRHPFIATTFFFSHRAVMEKCASLVTFRSQSRESILAYPKKHPWLQLGKKMSHRWLLLLGLTSYILCAIVTRGRAAVVGPSAAAFISIGLLMVLANSFLTEYKARHLLPMWELTIVATTLVLGQLSRASFRRRCPQLRT